MLIKNNFLLTHLLYPYQILKNTNKQKKKILYNVFIPTNKRK